MRLKILLLVVALWSKNFLNTKAAPSIVIFWILSGQVKHGILPESSMQVEWQYMVLNMKALRESDNQI